MFVKIRPHFFETNSSSTHCFLISEYVPFAIDNSLVPDRDGIVVVRGGEWGWEWFKTNKADEKVRYAFQDGVSKQELAAVIKEVLLADDVVFDDVSRNFYLSGAYIDHQSEGRLRKTLRNRDDLKNFIFNQNSWLLGGNDNEEYAERLDQWGKSFYSRPWEVECQVKQYRAIKNENVEINLKHNWQFYQNGNCKVAVCLDDGTRIVLCQDEQPKPIYPLSVDVRLSSYCPFDCDFCHEDNGCSGQMMTDQDADEALGVFSELPAGVEVAVGINYLDEIVEDFLRCLSKFGLIVNITVNQLLIAQKPIFDKIASLIEEKVVRGVGVSYRGLPMERALAIQSLTPNMALHVIVGIDAFDDIVHLPVRKMVVLGYKEVGRAKKISQDYSVEYKIKYFSQQLPRLLTRYVAFDTLALEQLKMWRFFHNRAEFEQFKQPEYSLYVDVPRRIYKPSSVSPDKVAVGWNQMSLQEMFENTL